MASIGERRDADGVDVADKRTLRLEESGVPAASLQKFTLAYCTQGQPLSSTFPFQ
jgi:hypothetical protein